MMMFPNASRGYMPFCPSYEERKKAHERRTRHRSGEEKKRRASNSDPRKTHSTPALTQYKLDKPDLKFMSVPDLDLSRLHELWEDEEKSSKKSDSVLKSFLGLFKKSKTDKVRDEQPSILIRKRTDSEKENFTIVGKPRLESIKEEDENVDSSNGSVTSSSSSTHISSSTVTKPISATRRHRTAMTALGTSPTSEAPAKKCATQPREEDTDDVSTASILSHEEYKSQSDLSSTSSSSIEKQG